MDMSRLRSAPARNGSGASRLGQTRNSAWLVGLGKRLALTTQRHLQLVLPTSIAAFIPLISFIRTAAAGAVTLPCSLIRARRCAAAPPTVRALLWAFRRAASCCPSALLGLGACRNSAPSSSCQPEDSGSNVQGRTDPRLNNRPSGTTFRRIPPPLSESCRAIPLRNISRQITSPGLAAPPT